MAEIPGQLEKLTAALERLPAAASEPELLQALVQAAGASLGCRQAIVYAPDPQGDWRAVAAWPGGGSAAGAGADGFPLRDAGGQAGFPLRDAGGQAGFPLRDAGGQMLARLQADGADPDLATALAAVAGRLLAEARERAQLLAQMADVTRRTRAAEAQHHLLVSRFGELYRELSTTQDRHLVLSERNRIAQDLHDRAAQTFFLVGLKAEWLLAQAPTEWALRPELERLRDLAVQGAAQTREAIYALRAPELAADGLTGGLRRLVRELEAEGMAARLTVTGHPVELAPAVEDGLFKLAQEALSNARKHSGGTAVMVTLRFAPGAATLVVQDDGAGLPADALTHAHRYGLTGMRERVAALGGELLLLNDEDEGGLIVRATIPLIKG